MRPTTRVSTSTNTEPNELRYEPDDVLRYAQTHPFAVPSFTIRNLLAELIERREQDAPEWRCPNCGAVTRARMADQGDGLRLPGDPPTPFEDDMEQDQVSRAGE
jgi:hypothetical protein